jgi:hypothetical protein
MSKLGRTILKITAIGGVIIMILLSIKNSGKQEERLHNAERRIKSDERSRKEEIEVNRNSNELAVNKSKRKRVREKHDAGEPS